MVPLQRAAFLPPVKSSQLSVFYSDCSVFVVIFLLQFLWFWGLALQSNWGQTLTGCFSVVLPGRSCSTVHTGKRTFREHCDSGCK